VAMNDPTDLINQLRVAIVSVLKEMELDVPLDRIVLDRPKSTVNSNKVPERSQVRLCLNYPPIR